jgi:energy-coupling factor transporter transmembrane protein EcfT
MEARCYRGGEGRTRMRAMVLQWADLWAALAALALGLAALAFNWLAVP